MKYYIITSLSQLLNLLFNEYSLFQAKNNKHVDFCLAGWKNTRTGFFPLLNCIHFREILVASSDKKWPEPYLHKVMNNVFILSMFDLLKTKNTSVSFSNVLACVSSCEARDGLIWQNFSHKLCIWKV